MTTDFVADAARHAPTVATLQDQLKLTWSYDPIYYAMEASLDEDQVPSVAQAFEGAFAHQLDAASAKAADAATQDLVSWSGGLQRNQRLFFSDLGVTTLFAVLWPWTEDSGCTVRIGLFHADGRIADREPLSTALRSWF